MSAARGKGRISLPGIQLSRLLGPMSSLSNLVAAHGSVLVLDTAGSAQAAWAAGPGKPLIAARASGDAGTALFQACRQLGLPPDAAGAFAFCEAPGSVLGIRTAAAAVRTWTALQPRPVYAFNALRLAAACAAQPAAFIADARRGLWHFCIHGQPMRAVRTEELSSARGGLPLATLEGLRHWQALPAGTEVRPYDLAELLRATAHLPVFEPSAAPDAALLAQPTYAHWTARIHQTPEP
jgi:tRNA threonylcarbamoyladenosine biosynthesis protein TsaB